MEERKKEKQIYFFNEHWQIDKKFNSLDENTRKKRLEPKTINEKKKTFFLTNKNHFIETKCTSKSHIQAFYRYILLQNLECLALENREEGKKNGEQISILESMLFAITFICWCLCIFHLK